MSLTKVEHATRREILVKFSKRMKFDCELRSGEVNREPREIRELGGRAPAALCPICFPGAFAADLVHAPRAVVCAGHYWHPVARLFRVASSLFLSSSGRCLTQNRGGRDPRVLAHGHGSNGKGFKS